MPLSQVQQDVLSLLKKANSILVLPSSPLDGDSLGSSLALYLALKKLGKKVTVVAEETVPSSYNFLPEIASVTHELKFVRDFIVTIDCRDVAPKNIRHEIQGNKINIFVTPEKGTISKENVSFNEGGTPFDAIVTVDAADPSQFGKIYEDFTELFHLVPVMNIDHHASNKGFGRINLVDIMASSTTMLILPLIEELGPGLMDADIATLLLAGLITDTGSFQNPNTTPDAFAVAAKLIGYGARQQEIIRHIYKTKKLSTLRLWGRTLTKIQYDEKHHMVWSVLTARDFAELGSSPDDTEGVIDELMSNAPGAEIIFLLKERNPTEASGSIRTLTPTIDASKLAGLFGGGGHVQAAGFKVQGKNIQETEQMVVNGLREFQKKRLGIFEKNADLPQAPIISPALNTAPRSATPPPALAQTPTPAPKTPTPPPPVSQAPAPAPTVPPPAAPRLIAQTPPTPSATPMPVLVQKPAPVITAPAAPQPPTPSAPQTAPINPPSPPARPPVSPFPPQPGM
ncbi:MAG: DHH family phosphoesterase [Patescibacteria group bacterium]